MHHKDIAVGGSVVVVGVALAALEAIVVAAVVVVVGPECTSMELG